MRSKHNKRNYDRTQRVADLIQKSLAQMLLEDMGDERFKLVTITSVIVSRDMSYAKIYVSMLEEDPEKIKNNILALNKASKFLRFNLAKAVDLRIVPELKFMYDSSTAHGFLISALIDDAIKKQ